MKKLVTRSLILAAAAFLLYGAAAHAQAPWISYAVKWVCGNVSSESGAIAVDGRYFTTVNIHNPHYMKFEGEFDLPVVFLKKIVLALPQGNTPLPHSCWFQEALFPDEALAVTCRNIKAQLAISGLPSAGLQEGFVVLVVPPFQDPEGDIEAPELDVTALYTGRSRAAGADVRLHGVSTWDVETVDFTAIRGDPGPFGPGAFCD